MQLLFIHSTSASIPTSIIYDTWVSFPDLNLGMRLVSYLQDFTKSYHKFNVVSDKLARVRDCDPVAKLQNREKNFPGAFAGDLRKFILTKISCYMVLYQAKKSYKTKEIKLWKPWQYFPVHL